jgi:hypothetical protein
MQPKYVETVINRVINSNVKLRDNHIQRYGIDVMVFTNNNQNNLTSLGEVSYFAERQGHVITILPNFQLDYVLLPFNAKGRADETDADKLLEAYVKTIEDVNKGDVIELTYSYYTDTVDRKYYQIGDVIVNSVYQPISKRILMHPYYLPVSNNFSQAVDDAPFPIENKGFIIG